MDESVKRPRSGLRRGRGHPLPHRQLRRPGRGRIGDRPPEPTHIEDIAAGTEVLTRAPMPIPY